MEIEANRKVYIDVIRVVAAFLVIFTHTGNIGSKLYVHDDYGLIRNAVYIMADIIRCINVPLFFMVSGALLLRKKESYRDLFKKRVLRYVIVLICMSYFYFVFYYNNLWNNFSFFFKQLCTEYVTGLYWFLYEYIGYLLILPLLRKMVSVMEKKDFQYLLIMGIFFKGLLNIITGLLGWDKLLIPFQLSTDAIFYPVMGYYISDIPCDYKKNKLSIKREIIFGFFTSCLCIAFVGLMMHWEALKMGGYSEAQETYLFSLNVIPTVYVFYIIKCACENVKISAMISKVFCFLGENSFGIYLFSIFAQVKLMSVYNVIIGIMPQLPLLACIIYIIIVMIIEAIGISLLRRIPGVRKLI